MNRSDIATILATNGLRLAGPNEAGWYAHFIGSDGERRSYWVTDI